MTLSARWHRRIALSISLILLQSPALAESEDLVIQTRLDQKSTSWLIDKIRLILRNSDLSDGMTDTTPLTEDTEISLDDFSSKPEFKKIKETISKVFHVDSKGAFLRIRIPKIYYKVHSLHARPENVEVIDPSVRLKAIASIQGVDIGLPEGVQMDFMIPNPKTGQADAYLTGFLKPVSVEIPNTLEPAEFGVDLEAIRDQEIHFNLIGSRLESLPGYVDKHSAEIRIFGTASQQALSSDDLSINPVVVRLNTLSRSISFDEFKPLVQKNMKNIISSVIKKIGSALKDSIGPAILKTVFSKTLPGSLSISSEAIYTRYLSRIFSKPDQDQLSLSLAGDLCTNDLFQRYKESCVTHMRMNPPIRTISTMDQSSAKEEVRSKIASGSADIALSVSEDYLNRLLQTTIDAKLWDEMLKEENLDLGPKGAFVVLKKAGAAPEIYLDVIYKGTKGLQSIIINPNHPIRFPLRLSTKLNFKLRKEIPFLVISIDQLKSDASEIINGIRDYDLPSDLVPGLRRKIASMILKMAGELEGRNAIEMELPVFKGLGLENAWQEPSAFGRLNLYFKL
jgi:hypothetical protein